MTKKDAIAIAKKVLTEELAKREEIYKESNHQRDFGEMLGLSYALGVIEALED